MITKKIIILPILSLFTFLGVASSMSALTLDESTDEASEIVLINSGEDYEVYAEESEVGYLQVTVID